MKIREKTEKKVFAYMEEHRMLVPGEKLVLGVSGGADSMCLLRLMTAYAESVPLSLAVVHVNHGIRRDAGEDARYVEELCRREGISFFLTEADVHALALKEKCSEEDAGRRVRYEALGRAAQALGGAKLAVAHNSNDNAETMLFHLFRGSGIKGLGGIAPVGRDPVSGNMVIRPLLCLERREVEAYLEERGIRWCADSTNAGDDYSRNRIRHHILPYAEQAVFGGAVGHMGRTAQLLRETEDYLEMQTEEALGKCVRKEAQGGRVRYVVEAGRFADFHGALRKRMLLTLAKELSPTGKDIASVHILDMLSLFEREENRSIDLPFGIRAFRQYEKVVLERRAEGGRRKDAVNGAEGTRREDAARGTEGARPEDAARGREGTRREDAARGREGTRPEEEARPAAAPGEIAVERELSEPICCELDGAEWEGFLEAVCGELFPGQAQTGGKKCVRMEFSRFPAKKGQEVPRNRYTKWFDYDKIKECMVIRTRRRGDYFTAADGRGGMMHKTLKDYMIAEKIPRQLRDSLPVLAEGSHVLWLAGWRISEYYKVRETTANILQVKLTGESCQGTGKSMETEEKDVRTH